MRLIRLALLVSAVWAAKSDDHTFDEEDVMEDVADVMEDLPSDDDASSDDSSSKSFEMEDPSENLLETLEEIKPQKSYNFQAETDRLMDIIVNSLYTERDVFLRELVSNSADALEKIRISNLKSDSSSSEDQEDELKIMVKLNKKTKEISVIDNGIGMSLDELEKNLGTVAKSGTSQFVEAAKRGDSASNLIGQFGVGFYSAFLVADEVTVISKTLEDKDRYIWVSKSKGGFSISKDTRDNGNFHHGTIVTLKLKDDAKDLYTDYYKIKFILQRFSAFVPFPIYLGEVKAGKKISWQLTNGNKPLWLRARSDIKESEYIDFFQNITKVQIPPLSWTHFKAEGDYEFTGLFYLPTRVPGLPTSKSFESGIKLYVQRVLISDNLKDFLPSYLSFMRGLVDSNDLPLKVDRENFSQMKVMRTMKKKAYTKIFAMFHQVIKEGKTEKARIEEGVAKMKEEELMADEPAPPKSLKDMVYEIGTNFTKYGKFDHFWNSYGDSILYGCSDPEVSRKEKEKILGLYHTHTTYGQKLLTNLEDYISRMLPGQRSIYLLTGDNIELMMKSPYLEYFAKHGVEVLLVTGPYDEQCLLQMYTWKNYDVISIEMDQLLKYEDLAFAIVSSNAKKGDYGDDHLKKFKTHQTNVIEDLKVKQQAFSNMYKPLLNWFNKRLGKEFTGVIKMTMTLPDSPARISIPHNGFTAAHERLMRTTINIDKQMIEKMSKNKNLELNPHHPLVYHLLKEVKEIKKLRDQGSPVIEREQKVNHMVDMLYESALIACGFLSRKPYLLLEDFYRLIQAEEHLQDHTVEIPEDILRKARYKVLGDRADDDLDDEEETKDTIEEDDLFNEKDEL